LSDAGIVEGRLAGIEDDAIDGAGLGDLEYGLVATRFRNAVTLWWGDEAQVRVRLTAGNGVHRARTVDGDHLEAIEIGLPFAEIVGEPLARPMVSLNVFLEHERSAAHDFGGWQLWILGEDLIGVDAVPGAGKEFQRPGLRLGHLECYRRVIHHLDVGDVLETAGADRNHTLRRI